MTRTKLATGDLAPYFTLQAIGSQRMVSPPSGSGAALMLVFHGQNSVAEVQAMQEAVRMRYPNPAQLLIASVVNMSVVPAVLRSTAESVMAAQYSRAAAAMPAGLDAADFVVILVDWDGKVSRAYGVARISTTPLAVLIDGQGTVCAFHRGNALERASLAMLDALFAADGDPV